MPYAHAVMVCFSSLPTTTRVPHSTLVVSPLVILIITVYGSACDYMLALVSIVCGTVLLLFSFFCGAFSQGCISA